MKDKSVRDPAEINSKDVPRCGFTCSSHESGHTVHYISVTKQASGLKPIAAQVTVSTDGFSLSTRTMKANVWTHNPVALRALMGELGSDCYWYPTLHLASWHMGPSRHWVSLSISGASPCISLEEMRASEELMWK